jgi:uncharacterized protein YdeI (YjbR/CyaY-like superfamily)
VKGERSRRSVVVPRDLLAALTRRTTIRALFVKMPPSHQRAYIGWIEEAKRPATRAKRIEVTIKRQGAGADG